MRKDWGAPKASDILGCDPNDPKFKKDIHALSSSLKMLANLSIASEKKEDKFDSPELFVTAIEYGEIKMLLEDAGDHSGYLLDMLEKMHRRGWYPTETTTKQTRIDLCNNFLDEIHDILKIDDADEMRRDLANLHYRVGLWKERKV